MSSNTFQVSAGTSFNRIKVAELLSTAVQKLDRKQEGGRGREGEREGEGASRFAVSPLPLFLELRLSITL